MSAYGMLRGLTTKTLWKMANKLPPTERPPAKKGTRLPPLELTDEQIVEARRLHEKDGVTKDELVDRFCCSEKFMGKVLAYEVRRKLFPPLRG